MRRLSGKRSFCVEDAVKAANVSLTAELEGVADSLGLNVVLFWEKEIK